MVMEGLDCVLKTPLGGPLAQLKLSQLGLKQRIHELSFDLPVSHVRTKDLVQAFRCSPDARFGGRYIDHLATLGVNSRGFLHRLDRPGVLRPPTVALVGFGLEEQLDRRTSIGGKP